MAKTTYKVGDKVLIKGLSRFCKDYIGKVGKVYRSVPDGDGDIGVRVEDFSICILPTKVELVAPKPTKNQRISSLEQAVEALQAEVESLKAASKVAVSTPEILVKSDADIAKIAERFAKMFAKEKKLTPNEQRKAIIDEAKVFIAATLAEVDEQMGWRTTKIRTYKEYGRLRIEFIVNAEKRTVVALARYGNITDQPDVLAKGIAKCAPDDVFNEHIGKAIALGRALGLDAEQISKFEKAVQPTEFAVGQVTKGSSLDTGKVTQIEGYQAYTERYTWWPSNAIERKKAFVIDDSEAQY